MTLKTYRLRQKLMHVVITRCFLIRSFDGAVPSCGKERIRKQKENPERIILCFLVSHNAHIYLCFRFKRYNTSLQL